MSFNSFVRVGKIINLWALGLPQGFWGFDIRVDQIRAAYPKYIVVLSCFVLHREVHCTTEHQSHPVSFVDFFCVILTLGVRFTVWLFLLQNQKASLPLYLQLLLLAANDRILPRAFMGEALQMEALESSDRIPVRKHQKTCNFNAAVWPEVANNVDMLNEIFKYLDASSLARASCVSKKWKQATDDEALWEAICTQHWPTTASHTGQLKSVVVALGGFRRLYVNCLHPLLCRNCKRCPFTPPALKSSLPLKASASKQKWSKDEVYLSLSLFSIDCYERIAPQTSYSSHMGFLCKPWADYPQPSATKFNSDVRRLLEGWRGKVADPPPAIFPTIKIDDVGSSRGSMDARSSK